MYGTLTESIEEFKLQIESAPAEATEIIQNSLSDFLKNKQSLAGLIESEQVAHDGMISSASILSDLVNYSLSHIK